MPNPYHDALGRFASKPGSGGRAAARRRFGAAKSALTPGPDSRLDGGYLPGSAGKAEAAKRFGGGRNGGLASVSYLPTAKKPSLRVGMRRDGTMDFDTRADYVEKRLTEFFDQGVSSESLYKTPDGDWTPERRAQQQAIMDEIWAVQAARVPNEGRAIFAGGLGGAGKGFTLKNKVQVDPDQYLTINPDDIKELMAKRGMIPDVDPNLTPMEASPLVHEEASAMAKELAERAYRERKNVVWDITMSSEKSVKRDRIDVMREAGYTDIRAVFVDVSVEKSVAQARKRWERGLNDYANGTGDGGRFLPSGATMANMPQAGSKYRSKNREVFEAVKGAFDGFEVYDNEDGSEIIAKSGGGVKG